ncbi:MAG TPA: hypothetical protein VGI03_12000 [Verrucomicrobiae bacterium]|jgi:hypothetical protein
METQEQIKANAELVIQELRPVSGMDFGYNKESVKWLEGHLEELRRSGAFQVEETKSKMADRYGSFLGECIIRCYGGAWTLANGFWGVRVIEGNLLRPIAEIRSQMVNGLKDGISNSFRKIADLYVPVTPPPLDGRPSIYSSKSGVIAKLFDTRFNELMADGTFSVFQFAEGLLAAKGLRLSIVEAVVQRAIIRIKRDLYEDMPQPAYLKDTEGFRKYLYSIIGKVVESIPLEEPAEIRWRDYNGTLSLLREKARPVLLFVLDRDGTRFPFLREILSAMPRNGKLRTLLNGPCAAMLLQADSMPGSMRDLGAGDSYHLAILAPVGRTPLVTFDYMSGQPQTLVEEIAKALEAVSRSWA